MSKTNITKKKEERRKIDDGEGRRGKNTNLDSINCDKAKRKKKKKKKQS